MRTHLPLRLVPIVFVALASSHVQASECDWVKMGVSGFQMRMDETSCARLLAWDDYLKENERSALEGTQLYTDPKYEFLLSGIVAKMQESLRNWYGPQPNYEVRLVEDNSINAFATGGQIFVNRGTLQFFMEPRRFWRGQGFSATEAEQLMRKITPWENDIEGLAFIIAHEVAHNVLAHPPNVVGFICEQHLQAVEEKRQRAQRRSLKDEELKAEGKKPGFWRKLGRALQTGTLESLGAVLGSVELSQYQQESESEADQLGVTILKDVGLDPRAGARSLGYLATIYGYAEGSSEVIKTFLCSDHPEILQRVERAESLGQWLAVGSRVSQVSAPTPADLTPTRLRYIHLKFQDAYDRGDFQGGLTWIESGLAYAPKDAGLLYNRACVLALLGRMEPALDALRVAIAGRPDLRAQAASDQDLQPLWDLPAFTALVTENQPEQ